MLLVDENDDNREMIALALESHGYQVDRANSADAALSRLREDGYRLVLGHYGMPDKNAAVMFKEAKQEGLLKDTATLVMSGQPDPVGVEGHPLIAKPLDLARLLAQVRSIIGPAPAHEAAAGTAAPVELALYLSLPWPSSIKARRNLEQVLSHFQPSQVHLTIHDLAKDPDRAERDGIVFSPTLVKQSPEPRAFVMGDLSDRRILSNLLLMCGLEPRKSRR